jgi:Family of unknown function (DUF6166)
MEEMETMTITLKGDHQTRRVWVNGELLDSGPSQKVSNDSPEAFDWGNPEAGSAQLALAILLKFTDRRTAVENYQDFKWEIIYELEEDEDFEVEINLNPWLTPRRKESIQ